MLAGAVTSGIGNVAVGIAGLGQALSTTGSGDSAGACEEALKPEAKYKGSGKHGIQWKEGPAAAKISNEAQGQWGTSVRIGRVTSFSCSSGT